MARFAATPRIRLLLLWALSISCVHSEEKEKTSPLHKVVELLTVMIKQVESDAQADATTYMEYKKWFDDQKDNMKQIIEDTTQTIETLKTDLEEQETFREGKKLEFESVSQNLAKAQKELSDAKLIRAKERKDFEAAEESLVRGVDQLERTLEVLGKQAPSNNAGALLQETDAATGLVEVAERLKTSLESGGDIALNAGQREVLHEFVVAAKRQVSARANRRQASIAPDFLQVKAVSDSDEDGPYESQTGSVTSTMQTVLDKTNEELEKARKTETEQKTNYDSFSSALQSQISNLEETRLDLKSQLTQSQQKSSEMQSQLVAATENLKVTGEQLQEVEAEFVVKTRNFKTRAGKRSDELLAVQEAHQILTSEAIQAASSAQTIGDFIQVGQHHEVRSRGAAVLAKVLKASSSDTAASTVSLLEVSSSQRRARRRRQLLTRQGRAHASPFRKVKGMIGQMLEKLEAQAASEQKHKEWCDHEIGKSMASKAEKEADVQKLQSRIDSAEAELGEVTNDVMTLTEETNNLNGAATSATKIRQEEHEVFVSSSAMYKDSIKLIKAAIKVLQKFYLKEDGKSESFVQSGGGKGKGKQDPDEREDEKTYSPSGMGSGVIGILEVAEQDYTDLFQAAELSETEAQNEFKEFMNQNEVRLATFEKDLEYKTRSKVRLEGELLRLEADLKSYTKELEAVESYLAQLEAQCIGKVDSYEERQARREKQLVSLKEALAYLTGEGA